MRLPAGHVRRLFLGFTCSIMFLVVFTLLVAYNTNAAAPTQPAPIVKERGLGIAIATAKPEETIAFYRKLGFRSTPGLTGGLDTVCMEKEGTPYKLEICHNKFSEAGPVTGGVSGMSFRVRNLSAQVADLKAKGFALSDTRLSQDGVSYASLTDPNGISIKLFER